MTIEQLLEFLRQELSAWEELRARAEAEHDPFWEARCQGQVDAHRYFIELLEATEAWHDRSV